MIVWGSRVRHRRRPRKTVSLQQRVRRPLEGRFALPNLVWRQGLKPAEFMILSCIYYWNKRGLRHTTEAAKLISERVHLNTATVKKHLAVLVGKGLIASEFSFEPTIPVQPDGGFFSLPNEVFTTSSQAAYRSPWPKTRAHSLRCSSFPHKSWKSLLWGPRFSVNDYRTHKCHPSIRTMAERTGLSAKTVQKHIGTLVDKDLILVENTSYLDKHGMKWNGNNEYTILSLCYVREEHRRRQQRKLDEKMARVRIARELEKFDRRHPRKIMTGKSEDDFPRPSQEGCGPAVQNAVKSWVLPPRGICPEEYEDDRLPL